MRASDLGQHATRGTVRPTALIAVSLLAFARAKITTHAKEGSLAAHTLFVLKSIYERKLDAVRWRIEHAVRRATPLLKYRCTI